MSLIVGGADGLSGALGTAIRAPNPMAAEVLGTDEIAILNDTSAGNILDGGHGDDTLIGGPGDDTYHVAGAGKDVITDLGPAGRMC